MLPRNLRPMRVSRRPEPFDSDDFIFELKIESFRSLVYIENRQCDLGFAHRQHIPQLQGSRAMDRREPARRECSSRKDRHSDRKASMPMKSPLSPQLVKCTNCRTDVKSWKRARSAEMRRAFLRLALLKFSVAVASSVRCSGIFVCSSRQRQRFKRRGSYKIVTTLI